MSKSTKLSIVPEAKYDLDSITSLAEIGLEIDDIGRNLGLTPVEWKQERENDHRIEEAINRGVAFLRKIILQAQKERAAMGDTRMLIHLGQQYCGQGKKEQIAPDKFEREKELAKNAIRKNPKLVESIFGG